MSFSRSDDDSQQGFALGFAHALIALADTTEVDAPQRPKNRST